MQHADHSQKEVTHGLLAVAADHNSISTVTVTKKRLNDTPATYGFHSFFIATTRRIDASLTHCGNLNKKAQLTQREARDSLGI